MVRFCFSLSSRCDLHRVESCSIARAGAEVEITRVMSKPRGLHLNTSTYMHKQDNAGTPLHWLVSPPQSGAHHG